MSAETGKTATGATEGAKGSAEAAGGAENTAKGAPRDAAGEIAVVGRGVGAANINTSAAFMVLL